VEVRTQDGEEERQVLGPGTFLPAALLSLQRSCHWPGGWRPAAANRAAAASSSPAAQRRSGAVLCSGSSGYRSQWWSACCQGWQLGQAWGSSSGRCGG